jgi:hypothetical protein
LYLQGWFCLTGGTATFSDENVATGKTVTLAGASFKRADADNYNLASTNTALLTSLTT